MRVNSSLDCQISAIADLINERLDGKPIDSKEANIAFAIYHTLRWARGRRYRLSPFAEVQKILDCNAERKA